MPLLLILFQNFMDCTRRFHLNCDFIGTTICVDNLRWRKMWKIVYQRVISYQMHTDYLLLNLIHAQLGMQLVTSMVFQGMHTLPKCSVKFSRDPCLEGRPCFYWLSFLCGILCFDKCTWIFLKGISLHVLHTTFGKEFV